MRNLHLSGHNGHAPKIKIELKSELKRVFHYMGSYKSLVIVAMIMALVGAIMTIIGPDKIGKITDIIKDGVGGVIDFHQIVVIGTALLIIYLVGGLATFIQHYIMATVTLKTSRKMRGEISEKINRVPQAYFNKTSQGDVLSRVTNDVSTLQQGLSNSLPTIISGLAQFIGCLVMMFVTEWRMALCTIVVTIIGFSLLMLITVHSQKFFIAKQECLGKLNGYVEEMYSGYSVVRSSRAENKVKNHFAGLNRDVYNANWKSQFYSGIMQPLMTAIGNIGYVVVCVVGCMLAFNNVINFGVIIAFILYVRLFTSPLGQIAQGITNLQTAGASAHRIFEFLNEEELSDESEKTANIQDVKGMVEFENVKFAYPDHPEKTIIKNFTAKIMPGQKVAIVGPTGAGKTTLVNLIMRFFETTEGEIKIDGVNTKDISRDKLHNMFSMVLQDTWLFEGSLRENLVYNMENVSDEKLMEVIKDCGLKHFVDTLPNGLDSVISESMSISSGQKQLLTIARAMVQNSSMLILDEATSSVDTRTELQIQRAMDSLTKNKTSFVIAHRLSTIKNADLILVMKDGDVIESGNHNQLMEKGGFYSELYNSQFENS